MCIKTSYKDEDEMWDAEREGRMQVRWHRERMQNYSRRLAETTSYSVLRSLGAQANPDYCDHHMVWLMVIPSSDIYRQEPFLMK